MRLLLKVVCVPLAALVLGLIFAIAPCYVFPAVFGTSTRDWCGYKSGPPHFELQFILGAVFGAVGTIWGLFVARRSR